MREACAAAHGEFFLATQAVKFGDTTERRAAYRAGLTVRRATTSLPQGRCRRRFGIRRGPPDPVSQLGRIPIVDALVKLSDSGIQEAERRLGAPLEPTRVVIAVKTAVGLGPDGLPPVERCERRVEAVEVSAGVPVAFLLGAADCLLGLAEDRSQGVSFAEPGVASVVDPSLVGPVNSPQPNTTPPPVTSVASATNPLGPAHHRRHEHRWSAPQRSCGSPNALATRLLL